MASKGFNIKTNLGGYTTRKTAFGTTTKKGPKLQPAPKPLKVKQPKPVKVKKPGLGVAPKTTTTVQQVIPGRPPQLDASYYNAVDLAQRKETQQLGQLDTQATSLKHDYGIDDPTNPFSRMEGLKRAFLAKYSGTTNALAAQGQGYTGAHERALARTRLEEEQARADLRQSFDQAMSQIDTQKAGIKFDTEEERNAAFEDWLARAPESEPQYVTKTTTTGGGKVGAPAAKMVAPTAAKPARAPVVIPAPPKPVALKPKAPGEAEEEGHRQERRR